MATNTKKGRIPPGQRAKGWRFHELGEVPRDGNGSREYTEAQKRLVVSEKLRDTHPSLKDLAWAFHPITTAQISSWLGTAMDDGKEWAVALFMERLERHRLEVARLAEQELQRRAVRDGDGSMGQYLRSIVVEDRGTGETERLRALSASDIARLLKLADALGDADHRRGHPKGRKKP